MRSAAEFKSGYLPQALTFSLDEIETLLPRSVKGKNEVLLLHCQSGMRSGTATTKLKALGYANVFNMGWYARAATMVITTEPKARVNPSKEPTSSATSHVRHSTGIGDYSMKRNIIRAIRVFAGLTMLSSICGFFAMPGTV